MTGKILRFTQDDRHKTQDDKSEHYSFGGEVWVREALLKRNKSVPK